MTHLRDGRSGGRPAVRTLSTDAAHPFRTTPSVGWEGIVVGQPTSGGRDDVSESPTSGIAQPADDIDYPPERSAWIGWIIFAALMLVLLGIFQLVAGFVAVVDESYFQQTGAAPLFLAVDQQTWGVLMLVLGSLAILTGAGLLVGNVVARAVGLGIALVAAVTNLLAIGAYPWWSVIMIALDVLIIYAIAVHGREMKPTA
jgi:hypothetical protein